MDAEVRGAPWGTLLLMAANLAVGVLGGWFDDPHSAAYDGLLEFGTIAPLTWITSAFVHADWLHLLFNLIFLWSFGYLVETLLGGARLILVYLVLAATKGALVQLLMLGADGGGAGGASGAIMGLMALSALWMPRCSISVVVWFLPLVRTFETTVWRFCKIWIVLDLIGWMWVGFSMSSAFLHLVGAAVGCVTALVMLRRRWVDTEGWDAVALTFGGSPAPRAPRARPAPAPEEDRATRIDRLRAEGRGDLAIPLLEAHLADCPHPDLRLALVEELLAARRPDRAREHLAALDPRILPAAARARFDELAGRARAARRPGRLELE